MSPELDTIAAVATGPGPGAVGIVRVSGSGAGEVGKKIFSPGGQRSFTQLEPRKMHLGWILGPSGALDRAQACFYPGPNSYTGEDLLELFVHGGIELIAAVLDLALAAGARPAGPGEFTRRAVLAGKMDLNQAEAVAWLIEAESRAEVEQAARQLQGSLGESLNLSRRRVLTLLADLEVTLDCEEYEEVPVPYPRLAEGLARLREEFERLLEAASAGEKLRRGGVRVVLAGSPNSGKSSLLNRLLERERAIVSATPGTTRDVLEEEIDIEGVNLCLVDTAGIRRTAGEIEAEGVRRAREEVARADLVVIVLDGSGSLSEDDRAVCRLARSGRVILVANKQDLVRRLEAEETAAEFPGAELLKLSAREGTGIKQLRRHLAAEGRRLIGPKASVITLSRRRRRLLEDASESAARAEQAVQEEAAGELIALELREIAALLAELTGQGGPEEILEEIFSRFCVGK